MIIIFVFFWLDALGGMEQETEMPLEVSPVLPLKEIAIRNVCGYLVDKKISVDQVRQKLPRDIIKLIATPEECVLKYKDIDHCILDTITPNHRYILARGALGIVRLDLVVNKAIIVADSSILSLEESRGVQSDNSVKCSLSPSGNLVVFVAPQKW